MILSFMAAVAVMAQGMAFEPEGTTLEQASAKAKAEKKLIFLDCFTQWCGPCKKMARDVFPQETVGKYMNDKFVNLQIDMESEYGEPLAKKLQISAYPTFVIFNADGKEIGRFLGSHDPISFVKKVEETSKDNASQTLEQRWASGDRTPEFLREYLSTLNASYKADDANDVAEALLKGKETTFADDADLRGVFLRNISNPFSAAFIETAKNPEKLIAQVGEAQVMGKIQNVLSNYQRKLITEGENGPVLDQAGFEKFKALLGELKTPNANHYTLSTLITLAEKQKNFDDYLMYIKQYLADPTLDASDMQLANWVKPFADPWVGKNYKEEMKGILLDRIADIKSGKRKAQNKVGNMMLSRPTDELLGMLVDALDGKMPNQ